MALTVVLGAFGSLIGSFLNVVVYRVPAGRSIVSPPSACGSCGHAVRPYDNIPVISWLVLRGRCRDCKARISVRYPLVELGAALFFAIVALRFLPEVLGALSAGDGLAVVAGGLQLAAYLYFASISIALALIDIDVHRLPDVIVLPAYVVGAVLFTAISALTGAWPQLGVAAIGLAALGGLYFLIAFIRPDAMGLGDVKLAGVLGLFLGFLGWEALAVGTAAIFLLGGIGGLIVLAIKGRRTVVPYGPYLLAGAWVGILVGDPIARWYLALFGLS